MKQRFAVIAKHKGPCIKNCIIANHTLLSTFNGRVHEGPGDFVIPFIFLTTR
jgi:hypothetical protein